MCVCMYLKWFVIKYLAKFILCIVGTLFGHLSLAQFFALGWKYIFWHIFCFFEIKNRPSCHCLFSKETFQLFFCPSGIVKKNSVSFRGKAFYSFLLSKDQPKNGANSPPPRSCQNWKQYFVGVRKSFYNIWFYRT
jgi:hypothetical protein